MIKRISEYPNLAVMYLGIGVMTASLSMCSNVVFYAFGPGAIWNVGFVAAGLGIFIGTFMSFLRVVIWPYGIYVLINDPDGFFPWLFYLWYQ